MAFTPGLAFHALTPLYDMLNAALGFGRPFMRRVQAALALRGHEAVLDIGSGTGTLLAALAARHPAAHLAGLDADGRMLARARTKLDAAPRVLLLQAYAQALPFRSAAFDVVVSTLIFHHLPTPVKRMALAEVRRVLKPGGRFLLADFGKPQSATGGQRRGGMKNPPRSPDDTTRAGGPTRWVRRRFYARWPGCR